MEKKKAILDETEMGLVRCIHANYKYGSFEAESLQQVTQMEISSLLYRLQSLASKGLVSIDVSQKQKLVLDDVLAEKYVPAELVALDFILQSESKAILFSELEAALPKTEVYYSLTSLEKLGIVNVERGDGYEVASVDPGKKDATEQMLAEYLVLLDSLTGKKQAEVTVDDSNRILCEILKKRKIGKIKQFNARTIKLNPDFESYELELEKKPVADLTAEMLKDGSWETTPLKEFNLGLHPDRIYGGRLAPLRELSEYVRKIFLNMGYEEMEGAFVDLSFWNFDALFTRQNHPARRIQDTFYLGNIQVKGELDQELVKRVRESHEFAYDEQWDINEARRPILRTHTTDLTAHYLTTRKKLPLKLFAIGRVFRNETTDNMHLPEFHQIEGVVVDEKLSLRNLIGTLSEFYSHLGLKDIKLKPTYNPYTEPSMEIYAYFAPLGKYLEIANSGLFRPEMMSALGHEGKSAIAWGLALERLAALLYGTGSIRELLGSDMELKYSRERKKLWL